MIYHFQIYEYSQLMDDSVEKEISCDFTLKIIDIILLNETSLNKPTVRKNPKKPFVLLRDCQIDHVPCCFLDLQQVKKLQELVQLVTINRESTSFVLPIATSKSISSSASISPIRQLKSLQIFKTSVKTMPFSCQIFGWELKEFYVQLKKI